jgi:hypothetical protein
VGFPSPGLENRTKRIREDSETDIDRSDNNDNVNDIDNYADRADKDYEERGQGFEEVDTQEEEEEETPEEDTDNKGPPAKTQKAGDGRKIAVVKKKTCSYNNAVSNAYIQQFKKGFRPTAIQHSSIIRT